MISPVSGHSNPAVQQPTTQPAATPKTPQSQGASIPVDTVSLSSSSRPSTSGDVDHDGDSH
jgi:hypothetical protein